MKSGTEWDRRRRIARVVAAIVAEPSAPHTVESLSAIAHLSPFHFHRICFPEVVEQLGALCKDRPGVDRDTVHQRTAQRALAFFDEALPP